MQKELSDFILAARRMQITPTARDAKLTRQHVAPVRSALLELVRRHRRETDVYFAQNPPADSAGDDFPTDVSDRPSPYPLGYCRQIRDRVWTTLSNEPMIRTFRKYGLAWKKVYFIQEGRWFQNAIQCGDWLLDVARDTVNKADEPVACGPLNEFEWENLDNWHRFAEVAAVYYRVTVYPNLYFPLLFPLIPFLAIRETGRLELLYCQQMLFFLDLADRWRRCRAVLEDRELMARPLPSEVETRLLAMPEKEPEPFPVELRKSTVESLEQGLSEWDQLRGLPRRQLADTLQDYGKLARVTAQRLRKADVYIDLSLKNGNKARESCVWGLNETTRW